MSRKFRYLHARVLLDLQTELTGLEEKLHFLDTADAKHGQRTLRSRDGPDNLERRLLLCEIEGKLGAYCMPPPFSLDDTRLLTHGLLVLTDKVVERIKAFEKMTLPPPQKFTPFAQHIVNTIPIDDVERSFLSEAVDLVTLADGEEQGWLDGIVDRALNRCSRVRITPQDQCS